MLYVSDGRILECTGSNIFIVKSGQIATPGRDILFGVTRKLAIELAKKEFSVEERDISLEEMFAADEVFITGSFKEIVPIVLSTSGRSEAANRARSPSASSNSSATSPERTRVAIWAQLN